MSILVVKFGGTSVADVPRLQQAARKVQQERARGQQLVVIVSAMAGVTNTLIDYCRAAQAAPSPRDYDAVIASGEQVTSGLMALCLQEIGLKAKAYQGWQVPILTTADHSKARIEGIPTDKLHADLAAGIIPVIAGFQGVTADGAITTLGRGGSDTSAVAVAAALKAVRCDIYTDVDGIYTTDPRLCARAQKLARISSEEMLELASLGAKVLQTRSVELALRYQVPVQVLSSFGHTIGSDLPGTLLGDEENEMEAQPVTGIAYSRDETQITLRGVPDKPGIAAAVLAPLAQATINIDMIVQNASAAGATDLTFTLAKGDAAKAEQALAAAQSQIGYTALQQDSAVAKISVIGVGMRSHPGVAALMFRTLSERGINIRVIATSEIKISVLIDDAATELAVRALHTAYGLDGAIE